MSVEPAVLAVDPIGVVRVVSLEGDEGMNRLPRWQVVVECDDGEVDLEALLRRDATLTFGDEDGFVRSVPLIVVDASYVGSTRRGHRYDLILSTATWLLTQRHGTRAFIDMGAGGIVEQVLDEAGVTKDAQVWRMSEALHERPQCVQYAETEWDFVTRLLADEGISFWHDTDDDGAPRMVFADHGAAHDSIDGDGALAFEDGSGMSRRASSFHVFERTVRMAPAAVHVRDYDVDRPDVLVEGRAGEGPYEHFEYPAWTPTADIAARRAKVRLEQLRRFTVSAQGESHSARLVPGRTVRVHGTGDDDLDGDYLVVDVAHELRQPYDESEPQSYKARCRLVPYDPERAHRPAVHEAPPRIEGLESAQVTGPASEEIHVDELGSVKLRPPWDRSGITDDRSSCWARSMQLQMDGSMLLPRVGWEVSVAYRDGRPDQPLVLGKLYNATATVPYPLPANKATASFMSGTSPRDGSVNEIRLVDDAGEQQFAVQASGDQGVFVGGKLAATVLGNETYNVKGNVNDTIKGTQTVDVGGNQTITSGSGFTTKVKGARQVGVMGNENITVILNRTTQCGSTCSQVIGGLYFVRCNTSADNLKGDFASVIGGLYLVAAGAGVNETVLGSRTEACSERLVVTGQFEDKAYGGKFLTTGPSVFSIGGGLTTNCKGSATINAAAVSMKGSTVVLNAGGAVTINAGAFSAGALKMAGVHNVGGKTVLDTGSATLGKTVKVSS